MRSFSHQVDKGAYQNKSNIKPDTVKLKSFSEMFDETNIDTKKKKIV